MVLTLISAHSSFLSSVNGALGDSHWPPFMVDDDSPVRGTEENDHRAGRGWNGRS